MKVVFMGTPKFAAVVLEELYASQHEVVAVVCGTDKPAGRGKKLVSCPAKQFALKNNLPVLQFQKISSQQGQEELKKLNADVFVTAAYGQILSKEILTLAKFGTINVHGSLLPKYRGAAPVQYALLNGERQTGITIMQTDVGVDDGDILLKKVVDINPEDTTDTLMIRLAQVGGKALVEALDLLEQGKLKTEKQNHSLATKTRMLRKENSFINFDTPAESVVNFVRAYYSNPTARFIYKDQEIKVIQAKCIKFEGESKDYKPGQVVVSTSKLGLIVACNTGFVEIVTLQAQGSKPMPAKAYLNGRKIEQGSVLNEK